MPPILELRTFGGAVVLRGGVVLAGAATQKRLLALLAVLSAAGDAGVSREKLLGILWSESEPERARHALTQTLYHARRTLECPTLFLPGSDLRLNADVVTSDAHEFGAALERDELERAVALYRGPFLDGLFLNGAPEFERWLSAKRFELEQRMAAALEELALRAEADGGTAAAVEWWRRLATLKPFDSRVVTRLMTATAAAGDRAGALQHARVHQALIQEQLGAEPDPAIQALTERIRELPIPIQVAPLPPPPPIAPPLQTPPPPQPVVGSENGAAAHTSLHSHVDEGRESHDESRTESRATHEPAPNGSSMGRRVWKVAAVAFLVVSVTALAWRQRLGASMGSAAGTARTMVVAPFRVSGADPSLAFLREGMIDLLAVRLADAEGTPVADPGSVISAWREAGRELSTDVPQSAVLRLAARLGASQVVTGNIVGSHSNIVITATLSRVAGNELEARVTVNGPVDSLTALVDRLAVRLLATEAGEDERLARQTTPSMSALRAYLDGQAAYRRSKYQEAARDFERAVRDDSTFALAALYLALAADRVNEAEQHDRALALAWASRDELSDRDEAHLVAFAGPRYPAPSPAAEQLAAWQRAVTLAPDRADVWVELGERLLYDGAALGIPDHIAAATAALHRALALDPELGPARHLLLLAAAHADDPAALRALTAAHPEAADTDDALRWRMAVALGDSARLRDIRSRMATLDRSELRAIGMMSQFDAVAPADAEKALLLYRERAPLAADQLDAILALHSLALNQGRPALALRLTEQLQELQPLSRAHLRLRVLDALYGDGDSAAAASAAQTLASYADARGDASPLARATRLADICVVAQWRLAHGDIGPVPRAIEQLRSQRIPREPVPIAAAPVACGELLDASLAVATGARDAAARVSRLDSLMLTGPAVGDAASYAHILLARLHTRLGHPRLALGALERRTYLTGWPRYRSTALRIEAQLAEQVGERERAARAERRYKELRGATGSGLGS